jgi:Domain of unknown function (DUF4136)
MKARLTILTALLLSFVSFPALAQKINVDYDKTTAFTTLKTYTWKKGTPTPNPLMDTRVIEAIDKQMAAKGILKVDASANPDLIVVYHAAVEYETQLNTTDLGGWGGYGPYGGYYGGGGGTSTTTVDKIPVGTLMVDIGDVKAKKLVWRGKGTDTMSDKPEKIEKKINQVVEKMFKKFPPPPAKTAAK